ncbi:uncharacterized protein [Lolium perenne]|uniref:uncharacterized protein n=1 Tax=Lolium perenne TaxID=4522 RepID=UPI0021EB3266|nr:uncharacterized protein LOC127312822 [Lolium perenne]
MKHLLLASPLPLLAHGSASKPVLLRTRHRRSHVPSAAPDGNSGETSTAASEPATDTQPKPPSNSSPSSVKNRLAARNQARRAPEMVYLPPVEVRMMRGKTKPKASEAAAPRREKQRKKKGWDEMSLPEKAVELYVGEKGALFWLNKFAYASIFIMAGAWILFRFVGPLTGLYQLDAPPLAPTDVLRGS